LFLINSRKLTICVYKRQGNQLSLYCNSIAENLFLKIQFNRNTYERFYIKSFKKKRTITFALLLAVLFQAQIPDALYDGIDDNDPRYERPTKESYTHFTPPNNHQPMVVTVNDFDNFDAGIDFYEQYGSSNPNNPLWIFLGLNASGSRRMQEEQPMAAELVS
jgi:hypothetical protein